tara:strand:- start:429 stop:536 length:108 start_codon:yes stop_codon:yes gene_type:complete
MYTIGKFENAMKVKVVQLSEPHVVSSQLSYAGKNA